MNLIALIIRSCLAFVLLATGSTQAWAERSSGFAGSASDETRIATVGSEGEVRALPVFTTRGTQARKTHSWHSVGVDALSKRIGQLVSVVDTGGFRHVGALYEVGASEIVLEHASVDGGGQTGLSRAAVRELYVFSRAP